MNIYIGTYIYPCIQCIYPLHIYTYKYTYMHIYTLRGSKLVKRKY